jgi:hypothetical protein
MMIDEVTKTNQIDNSQLAIDNAWLSYPFI